VVNGRIDAIFAAPGGGWEVVDYKTGRRPDDDDPMSGIQLDVYALACMSVWRKRREDLTLTYFYLSSGQEVSHPAASRTRCGRASRNGCRASPPASSRPRRRSVALVRLPFLL
jgi:RecB family exonuclease